MTTAPARTIRNVPKPKKRGRAAAGSLTKACASLLKKLEADLRASIDDRPDLKRSLEAEWKEARTRNRTAHGFTKWLDELVTQVGASWIISAVFVRFVEDNGLIDQPLISGPTHPDAALDRMRMARDAEQAYYREHPDHAEREYLLHIYSTLAHLPGLGEILGERHSLCHRIQPRIEGGRWLVEFFRALDDDGNVRWDFRREDLNTRFLGDLYQDLSESARKSYALLQTPEFVEEFILDRTLTLALETFAKEFRDGTFRLIDPTCGSGHFLLGAFRRLVDRWRREQPGLDSREHARRALEGVWGVDLNPFAAAITRFRLLVAALATCGVQRLGESPSFQLHIVVGDSLVHGRRFPATRGIQESMDPEDSLVHFYRHEDRAETLNALGQQYHVVVGNPPYITPKDKAVNEAYRKKYGSCHGKYALSVPFMERFVELAVRGEGNQPAGFVGKITGNSFMKREFGKKLIEQFFRVWDLTHVIDTSGAYIPGHGTPTVILFLRNRFPVSNTVRTVMGIRGEPATPADPSRGFVWQAILAQLDRPGSESDYVSVEDKPRRFFASHPWSLGGGGAAALKERLEASSVGPLGAVASSIGVGVVTAEDDAFNLGNRSLDYAELERHVRMAFVEGDRIRDWMLPDVPIAIFPYDCNLEFCGTVKLTQLLWPFRSGLMNRLLFKKTQYERGRDWREYGMVTADKLRTSLSIAFAFVATHNHFVLDRGGKVFKQSAPVIKLPPDATEDDHIALLGILNSSTACFWGRQVFHNKGSQGISEGAKTETWERFVEWDGTKIKAFPLPERRPLDRALALDRLAQELGEHAPSTWASLGNWQAPEVDRHHNAWQIVRRRMIAEQEELDWDVHQAYGLTAQPLVLADPEALPPIDLGQRAFEIVVARRMAAGDTHTTWFERHGSRPITQIPRHWPEAYRSLVERRIALIESDRDIRLIEQPEHKRRWNTQPWDNQLRRALDEALLDRIESLPLWKAEQPRPVTIARLAEKLAADDRLTMMLGVRDQTQVPDADRALADLVEREAVPFLPVRYLSTSGMRKRAEWEETWRLQRIEDPFLDQQDKLLRDHFGTTPSDQKRAREHVALWRTTDKLTKDKKILPGSSKHDALLRLRAEWNRIDKERRDSIGGHDTPPVPPKYGSDDFERSSYWRRRGKLDVPKERFIAYPELSPDGDETLLVGWAGWDHSRRAAALASLFHDRHAAAWPPDRLAPILQGIDQLVPWLHQWHAHDAAGNLGQAYEAFVEQSCTQIGLTLNDIRAWRPG